MISCCVSNSYSNSTCVLPTINDGENSESFVRLVQLLKIFYYYCLIRCCLMFYKDIYIDNIKVITAIIPASKKLHILV